METLGLKYRERYGKSRKAMHFDKEEIFTVKAGKKYNNYQQIQDAREDTEIYPTLEKYGSIEQASKIMNRTTDQLEGYGADLRGVTGLRDVFEMQKQADMLWLNLPLDVREAFGHSKETMIKEGNKILEGYIAKKEAERQADLTKQTKEEAQKGVTENE